MRSSTAAVVGQRQAQIGVRVHRHRRPAVRPHRQRLVLAGRRAHVLRVVGDAGAPRGPRCRTSAQSRTDVASPSSSGTSERPCVRCAGVDAEQVAQRRVQVDVGRERVARRAAVDAGPRDRAAACGRAARRSGSRACRRCPSRRGSGRGRCTRSPRCRRTRPVRRARRAARPNHASIIVSLPPYCARTWRASRSEITPFSTAPTVYGGQMRCAGSRPVVVVHRRVRLGRVERLVRIELVDEQQEAVVRPAPPRRASAPPRASRAGRGSRPRRGTSRASCRTACGRGRTTARRSTTGRAACATGRPRGRAGSPTR